MAKSDSKLPVAPEGFVVLLAPDGATGACFEGVNYEAVDGVLIAPVEACAVLCEAHGYVKA